jgi:hypothetical protein
MDFNKSDSADEGGRQSQRNKSPTKASSKKPKLEKSDEGHREMTDAIDEETFVRMQFPFFCEVKPASADILVTDYNLTVNRVVKQDPVCIRRWGGILAWRMWKR